ncbi:hypothetical protein HZS_2245, partial [Henneguya salminicola]
IKFWYSDHIDKLSQKFFYLGFFILFLLSNFFFYQNAMWQSSKQVKGITPALDIIVSSRTVIKGIVVISTNAEIAFVGGTKESA